VDLLLALAIALALVHFGFPLSYYLYLKRKWLNKPWDIRRDPSYRPRVSIILPTYNEAEFIRERLDNIYNQDYPRELVELIVADSGSNDGTIESIKEWKLTHENFNLKLVIETEKKGKLYALLKALDHLSTKSEIAILTDADAFWEPDALGKAVSYFADPSVGSVTACIYYNDNNVHENVYRNYYNVIRVAESKIYATPVHNGPFLAIRSDLVKKYGIPDFPGSDDSSFGSYIAFLGYRAIQADDIVVKEPIRGNQMRRRIRRAHHLIINFLETKKFTIKKMVYKRNNAFEKIWRIEWCLHIINPWLLLLSTLLLLYKTLNRILLASTLLIIGIVLLAEKSYRVWVQQQIYLLFGMMKALRRREVAWKK